MPHAWQLERDCNLRAIKVCSLILENLQIVMLLKADVPLSLNAGMCLTNSLQCHLFAHVVLVSLPFFMKSSVLFIEKQIIHL